MEAPHVGRVVDTTGAGDAFLGGLICGTCNTHFHQIAPATCMNIVLARY